MSAQNVVCSDVFDLFRKSASTLSKSIDILTIDYPFDPFKADCELAWEDTWRAYEVLAIRTVKPEGFVITACKPNALALMLDVFGRWNLESYVSLTGDNAPIPSDVSHQLFRHEHLLLWTRSGKPSTGRASVLDLSRLVAAIAQPGNFVVELYGKSLEWVAEQQLNYLSVTNGEPTGAG